MKQFLLLAAALVLLGCSDDEGTPIWRVWYAVQVTPDYDLKINYNSDKYFDSGERDTIVVHDSSYVQSLSGFWVGQRLQENKNDDYFINVQVDSLTPFTGKLGVFVYVNDTSLIDSVFYDYGTKEIQLEGAIPQFF